MARGGFRPGAGRKKNSVTAAQAGKEPAATKVQPAAAAVPAAGATPEPVHVLVAVMNGDDATPDGRPITPARVSAAKELLPFFTAKLATTNEKRNADFDASQLSDDDLASVIASSIDIINRVRGSGTPSGIGSGAGTAAAETRPE